MSLGENATPLNELNRDEWMDVLRLLRPDWDEDDIERVWADFESEKHRRSLHWASWTRSSAG